MQKQQTNLIEQCISSYQYSILNLSTNARLVILEFITPTSQVDQKQNQLKNYRNVNIIKLINLQGNFWPQFPISFQRKNYKTLHQVVKNNKQKLPVDLFIKKTLQNIIEMMTIIKKNRVTHKIQAQNESLFERDIKQVYISNYGNRITFLIQENSINHKQFIDNKTILNLLKANNFESNLNVAKQQLVKSQMQYGSQSFVNFVQMNSLYSVLRLLCLQNQNQLYISQSLHAVTSLLNFNHKFFHPPKDATRFLKKTCGINIYARTAVVQKKSQMCPQEIFLRCLFEIPPTKTLSNILGHPEGPIYLQKYSFSEKFIPKIQEVYYLKGIKTYFHKQNQRDFSYATFYSRINPQYLQSKNGKNWLNVQRQKQIEFEEDEQDNSESQDSQDEETKNEEIDEYKQSYKQFVRNLKKQQQSRRKQKSQKVYSKFFTNQNHESQTALQISQLDQIHNFILQNSLQICQKCMITLRNISFQQNTIEELYNMIHYGNQKYCLQCGDLLKQVIKNTKNSMKNSKTNVEVKTEVQKNELMKVKQQIKIEENKQLKNVDLSAQLQKQNKYQQTLPKNQNKKFSQTLKVDFMVKKQKESNQNVQEKMYEKFIQNYQIQEKKTPERQVFLFQNYLGFLALSLKQIVIISPDILHDSFQLSKMRGFLNDVKQQNSSEGEGLFCDIISVYLNNSISKLLIVGNQVKHYQISNLMNLRKQIKRKKYEIIQKNIIKRTIFQQFSSNSVVNVDNDISKTQKKKQIQNIPIVFDSIYTIVQNELAIANSKITQHYRTYQQDMKRQYKITVDELKILIQKIKVDLKDKIIKTSEQFVKIIKWVLLFITELVEEKATTIIRQSLQPTDIYLNLNFFTYQVQTLMNICATIVANCNQPGQAKLMQQCQSLICEAIALIVDKQNQISVARQQYIKMNQKQILKDMMEHFYYKKVGSIQKQQAKKLIQYHYDKFKTIFSQKLNAILMGNKQTYVKLQQNYKSMQLKILNSTIKVTDQILFSINQDTLFSAFVFLDEYYIKFQANVVQNLQIRTFLNLIRSTTNMTLKQDSINIKSYPQQNEKVQPQIIKVSTIYKIICDSLQKIQTLDQLIKGFRSSNKRLFNLISFLISQCYHFEKIQCWQIYHRVKLYLSRQIFYASNKQHLDKHQETLQILKFLWENRNKFLPFPNAQQPISYFIKQYHFVICIVILNMMPLFNIQAMYKIQLKNLGKSLRMFSENENYTEVEDYLIKVLRVRHNAAKNKRKQELASKQGGNRQKQQD